MNHIIKQAKGSPGVDAKLLQESLKAFKDLKSAGGVSPKGYSLVIPYGGKPVVKAGAPAGNSDPRFHVLRSSR